MHLPWPLPDRNDLRDSLVEAYSTARGYHDLRHLHEVLTRLQELGVKSDEVQLAAWYHDAVYDELGDNEERSAELALTQLADVDVDAQEVARLVRLTISHSPAPNDTAGCLLVDADLGILAADPERYAEYVAGVREEYSSFSDEDFAAGRLAVLERLAAKPTLFHSPLAQELWGPAAHLNLEREIGQLRAVLGLPTPQS